MWGDTYLQAVGVGSVCGGIHVYRLWGVGSVCGGGTGNISDMA